MPTRRFAEPSGRSSRAMMRLAQVIIVMLFSNSCILSDESSGSDAQNVAAQMGESGLPQELLNSDGICTCMSSSLDPDCDYIYLTAEVCNTLGYGGGGPYGTSDDRYMERNGPEFNNDSSTAIYVICPLPSIYYNFEGYSADDVEQVVIYGIDNTPGSGSQYDITATLLRRDVWDEADTAVKSCTISGQAAYIRSCEIEDFSTPIPWSDALLWLEVRIPYLYDYYNPSGLHSMRVCYFR